MKGRKMGHLELITVNKDYRRYKSTDIIPEGEYYKTNLDLRGDKKKQFDAIATQDRAGKFCWLLPPDLWVKRVINNDFDNPLSQINYTEGYKSPEGKLKEIVDLTNIKRFRNWQSWVLHYIFSHYGKQDIRMGIVAGLGSGKTLVGLVSSLLGKTIVFAPNHLHSNWLEQSDTFGIANPAISTYQSVHKVNENDYDIVIIDEVHYLKNPNSLRHKKLKEFCNNKKLVLGLTGTPTGARKALDWRWLNVIQPSCLPEKEKTFMFLMGENPHLKEVAEGVKTYVVDGWNEKKVATIIKPNVEVIPDTEYLADVPDKQYMFLWTKTPKKYKLAIKGAFTRGNQNKARTQALTLSDGFFYDDYSRPQWQDTYKIDVVEELIKETHLNEPIVIFASWKATIFKLTERLKEFRPAIVTGDSDSSHEVQKFTSGETNIIIINSRLTTGMNLQRSNIGIFVSNSTNPIDRKQAEGRLHRPNQKNKVTFYEVMARGTLDFPLREGLKNYENESENYIQALLDEKLKEII